MRGKRACFRTRIVALVFAMCLLGSAVAEEREEYWRAWQAHAVEFGRIMSRVKWTPVADGMPMFRGKSFQKGTEYTGVPYSPAWQEGRFIGFDVFLKTFLAAAHNPHSVLYTRTNRGNPYYGMVCSPYTSYALQCAAPYVTWLQIPPRREGVKMAGVQSAQAAKLGDIIYRPLNGSESHVEIVTGITKDDDGQVTHVCVEESLYPTTLTRNRSAADFNAHISSEGRRLYRITDLDAWRGSNRAESFFFPNYEEDSALPEINRVLLLDRGDWVAYRKNQVVQFNVMDKDSLGVQSLVVKRGDTVVEEIALGGPGIIERSFSTCGDYTAYCVMTDGTRSPACEFSVCHVDSRLPVGKVSRNEAWEVEFASENMDVIYVRIDQPRPTGFCYVWITDQDRQDGSVVISADVVQHTGSFPISVYAENRYGRLSNRHTLTVVD